MRLIVATKNKGKLKEIKKILGRIPMPIIFLEELEKKFTIRENGKTFLANARKKTVPVSRVYKDDYVAGEDSGLALDYLKGKPGVFSKRYCGRGATDFKNNLKILKELQGLKGCRRRAHFHCCLALARNGKVVKIFNGKLTGIISEGIKGRAGFGYDPIFYLPEHKKTVAQLSLEEKNKISHRSQAFKKLKKYLTKP